MHNTTIFADFFDHSPLSGTCFTSYRHTDTILTDPPAHACFPARRYNTDGAGCRGRAAAPPRRKTATRRRASSTQALRCSHLPPPPSPAWSSECPGISRTDPMMKTDRTSKAAPGRRRPKPPTQKPESPNDRYSPRQRAANRNFLAALGPGGEGRAARLSLPERADRLRGTPRDEQDTIFCCCRRRFNFCRAWMKRAGASHRPDSVSLLGNRTSTRIQARYRMTALVPVRRRDTAQRRWQCMRGSASPSQNRALLRWEEGTDLAF